MLLGALAGALLLKTSLFLPLPAARPGAQGRPSTAPAELIDRRQILIGEVLAGGHKTLENRIQQWDRGLRALLNLAYEL